MTGTKQFAGAMSNASGLAGTVELRLTNFAKTLPTLLTNFALLRLC